MTLDDFQGRKQEVGTTQSSVHISVVRNRSCVTVPSRGVTSLQAPPPSLTHGHQESWGSGGTEGWGRGNRRTPPTFYSAGPFRTEHVLRDLFFCKGRGQSVHLSILSQHIQVILRPLPAEHPAREKGSPPPWEPNSRAPGLGPPTNPPTQRRAKHATTKSSVSNGKLVMTSEGMPLFRLRLS